MIHVSYFEQVSGQRVVTVTSAALRGHGGALRAAPSGTIVRTLQPRSGVTGQVRPRNVHLGNLLLHVLDNPTH